MYINSIFLSLLWLAPSALAWGGCKNCLGADISTIVNQCYTMCDQAWENGKEEHGMCHSGCSIYVRRHKCCVANAQCETNAKVCLNDYFRLDKTSTKRSLPHETDLLERGATHTIDVPADNKALDIVPRRPELYAVAIRSDTTDLEVRDWSAKEACCIAAKTTLSAGALKVFPLINDQTLSSDTVAGLVLVAFGLSGSYACMKVFGAPCDYNIAGPAQPPAAAPFPHVVPPVPPMPGI